MYKNRATPQLILATLNARYIHASLGLPLDVVRAPAPRPCRACCPSQF